MYRDNSIVDVHHVCHWTQGLNYNTWNPFLGSPELKNSNVISWPKCLHLLGVLVVLLLLLPANSGLLVWLQQCEMCPQLSLLKQLCKRHSCCRVWRGPVTQKQARKLMINTKSSSKLETFLQNLDHSFSSSIGCRMVWSRPGVSDSILSQEVSKLVQGELRTLVTHYFFWKAIGREKVTQNAGGLLSCCLCRGEDLVFVVAKISGHLEWASTTTKKYFP